MARLRFPQFKHLAESCGYGAHLYALLLSNGVVKVGRTCSPRSRLVAHARLLPHGVEVVRHEVVPTQRDCEITERELIRRMSRIANLHTGYEWFRDVRWGAVVNLLRQISAREIVDADFRLLPGFPEWQRRTQSWNDRQALHRFLRSKSKRPAA